MKTDDTNSDTSHAAQWHDVPPAARGRRSTRTLCLIGLLFLLGVPTVMLVADIVSTPDLGPRLAYPITRRDLRVTITEHGLLESAENTEIKCQVRGLNTVTWVIDSGTVVKPGDVLVRLDTLNIEQQIDERTKYALWSQSAADSSKAAVARDELAVPEYEQGRYLAELMTLQKNLLIAKSRRASAKSMHAYATMMSDSGYVSAMETEEKAFALKQAELSVEILTTQLDVLKRFTRAEQLQTLQGNLKAQTATHTANVERAKADGQRRDRAVKELKHCVVRAERGGLVIHPSAAQWMNAPRIAEGTTVYMTQVLLLMPDLSQMQVKFGIHESVIDRVKPGLTATVTLPDQVLTGKVDTVANVTKPAGWWTGNEVRYDTTVALPQQAGLRPGMSAEVEILIADYRDVLTIPVAAVVTTDEGDFCWVKSDQGAVRRALKLGDTNEVFSIVKSGLKEGDNVLLNPLALNDARVLVAKTKKQSNPKKD